MKVEFAPLSVPLQRRLQTASVVQWVFSFLALGKRHLLVLRWQARAAFAPTPSLPDPKEDLGPKESGIKGIFWEPAVNPRSR